MKKAEEAALKGTLLQTQLELARAHLNRWAAEAKFVQLSYNLAANEVARIEAEVQKLAPAPEGEQPERGADE